MEPAGDSNNSAMIIDYFFYDSQTNTCARIFMLTMKFLKYLEDAVLILLIETNAVISYTDMPIIFIMPKSIRIQSGAFYHCTFYYNMRGTLGVRKFECIVDEVVHQLSELKRNDINSA